MGIGRKGLYREKACDAEGGPVSTMMTQKELRVGAQSGGEARGMARPKQEGLSENPTETAFGCW